MKTILKAFIFLLSTAILSCDSEPKKLTTEQAKAIITNCNTTIEKTTIFLLGERGYFEGDSNSLKEYTYVKRLEKEGYATVDSLYTKTLRGRTPKTMTAYHIALTDKAKPFIISSNPNQATVNFFKTSIKSINTLEVISENKTKAIVNYEKINTPFYEKTFDTSLLKNTPDIFTETIFLIKTDDDTWRCSSK